MYEKTEEFCREHGDDRLTAIVEAAYKLRGEGKTSGQVDDIYISDIEHQDVINCTITGSFGEEDVYFDIDDGNNAGTVVRSFGEDGVPLRERGHYIRLFDVGSGIRAGTLIRRTVMLSLYVSWVRGAEFSDFKKMEQAYAYDAHFAPGTKTSEHYRAYANKRGLTFGGGWIAENAPSFPFALVEAREKRVRETKADTAAYAEAQAEYATCLAGWLAAGLRENAASVARENAVEWREWAEHFAKGMTSEQIMARHRQLTVEEIAGAFA